MRSPSEPAARARGMTLVELMVTAAILGIVAVAAMQVSIGFQRQYAAENLKRESADTARNALIWIERDLRTAGYGMDPQLAFDFNIWQGTTAAGATWCNSTGGNVASTNCKRDNGPNGLDELVFYSRNANYWGGDLQGDPEGMAWRVTGSASANQLTLATRGQEFFPKNQIIQIICPAATAVLYASVAASTPATGTSTTINTAVAVPADPFRQDPNTLNCITGGAARAFLIERYRYYVEPTMLIADNQNVNSQVPTLVLDKGVDRNRDGNIDLKDTIKVATGVLDLQVAYTRPDPPAVANTMGPLVRAGGTPGVAIKLCRVQMPLVSGTALPCTAPPGLGVMDFTTGGGAAAYGAPVTGYGLTDLPLTDVRRQSPLLAAITEVQVAVVSRSIPRWRVTGGVNATHVLPALFNRAAGVAQLPFELYVADTAIPIRNTRTRALSFF